jgi:hypothetical protein
MFAEGAGVCSSVVVVVVVVVVEKVQTSISKPVE